jgi:hypothetical protein
MPAIWLDGEEHGVTTNEHALINAIRTLRSEISKEAVVFFDFSLIDKGC